jgi:hypothetical protein
MRLHAAGGFDVQVGESPKVFAESRAATFALQAARQYADYFVHLRHPPLCGPRRSERVGGDVPSPAFDLLSRIDALFGLPYVARRSTL